MKIAFLHGWTADAAMWQPVIALLPEFTCVADDRGYYGAPVAVEQADLVVTHSFGTMRALAAPPRGCRGMVAINGFDCFSTRPDFAHGTAPRVLDRMLDRLDEDPLASISEFRRRCGALPPDRPPIVPPLRDDLQRLRDEDRRGAWGGPLVLIHGANDRIVPPAMQEACFTDRAEAERIVLPGHGHLVPLTAAVSCAATIRQLADRIAAGPVA